MPQRTLGKARLRLRAQFSIQIDQGDDCGADPWLSCGPTFADISCVTQAKGMDSRPGPNRVTSPDGCQTEVPSTYMSHTSSSTAVLGPPMA